MANIPLYNSYTPLATFSGNVINNIYTLELDNLSTSQVILNNHPLGSEDETIDFGTKPFEVDAPYGACLKMSINNRSGAKVLVYGYDYLGQPILERLVATTNMITKKAFKYVKRIFVEFGNTTTITVERSNKIGLPYSTACIIKEIQDGKSVDTDNTSELTLPYQDTQTESSSDPRGLIDLGDIEGIHQITFICVVSTKIFTIDDKKVGGLFGIPHYGF